MLVKKNIEYFLLIVGFAAAAEVAVTFALAAYTYFQLLSDKIFEKYATLLVSDREAYEICVVYSICAVLVAIFSLISGYLELKGKERFGIIHSLTSIGILFFLTFIIYVYLPNLLGISNQALYQQAITSKSLPMSGVIATMAPLLVWLWRRKKV